MKEEFEKEERLDEVELIGEEGDVLKLNHIATVDYKGEKYVFFSPSNSPDDDEVVIFKIGNESGEEVLLPIEDDDILEEVYNQFERVYDEDNDEIDCKKRCEGCPNKSGCGKIEN